MMRDIILRKQCIFCFWISQYKEKNKYKKLENLASKFTLVIKHQQTFRNLILSNFFGIFRQIRNFFTILKKIIQKNNLFQSRLKRGNFRKESPLTKKTQMFCPENLDFCCWKF